MSFQPGPSDSGNGHSHLNPRQRRSENVAKRDVNDQRHCSICEKPFEASSSPCLPFCSIRCQQLDLRKWMTEGYGLPLDGQEDLEHDAVDE